jgi:hypothetical protein
MASLALPALSLVLPRTQRSDLNCTIETCPIDSSYYFYRISLGANATFIALFSISLIGYVATYAFTRRATAFTVAMLSGVVLEVLGYAGRLMSWQNQWSDNGFLMQIVCLTIAPAFMAGGIYLCLRRIVYAFGPENSRIAPESYTRIVSFCAPVGHSRKLIPLLVHSVRSWVTPPPRSWWWNCLCSDALQQISQHWRQYHDSRSVVPGRYAPHLHLSLRGLRSPHIPALQVHGRGRLRPEPHLHPDAGELEVQGLCVRTNACHDLHLLEKRVQSCGVERGLDRELDQAPVAVRRI